MNTFSLIWLLGISLAQTAASLPSSRSLKYELQMIHQFPNGTWIENMAMRRNGQIMATDVAGSKIYLVDPKQPQSDPVVVATFDSGFAIAGITEIEDDVFYTTGTFGDVYHFQFRDNTSAVWEVDMRHYSKTGQSSKRKVADLPAAGVPNGMTLLSKKDGTILVSDSKYGLIWRVNIYTGASEVVLDDPKLKPVQNATVMFGVNGIHIVDSFLYFANTNQGLISKYPISREGFKIGEIVDITTDVRNADDFAIDKSGAIWLAENTANRLVRVSPEGQVQCIVGGSNSTALIGPVATKFGRGCDDHDILYISTDGLTFDAKGAIVTNDGKIAAIDTKTPRLGDC
ncbi:NHL repeat-containing protein [Thozetella sp. PMI_491]|nr:NHL repeat-containing protein [Thozetella sp. PMI_491]